MKKLFTLITLMTFNIYVSHATVRTVSNSASGGSQFGSLQAAYDAASSGDTLVIENTDITYNITNCAAFAKKLTLIGIGYNPAKQLPKKTRIGNNGCSGSFRMNALAAGSRFYGIEFIVPFSWEEFINDIVFENCKFSSSINVAGCADGSNSFTFRNCIFDNNNAVNFNIACASTQMTGVFSNCVFDGHVQGFNSPLLNFTFDHSLFLSTASVFLQLHYATIKNSVFMNVFPSGTVNSSYENNLCRVAGTFPPLPASGNTGSGNISNTDPLFVNLPFSTQYAATQDYHLQAGSAAIGAGNDGTDIGIHGGFSGYSESGEVLINPIIRSMNIVNTSVAPNGTLNVNIRATKPDND